MGSSSHWRALCDLMLLFTDPISPGRYRTLKTATSPCQRGLALHFKANVLYRILRSKSSQIQEEHLKAICRNQKQATYKKICESHIKVTFKRTGIGAYKEWTCATGDSATYFVAVELSFLFVMPSSRVPCPVSFVLSSSGTKWVVSQGDPQNASDSA